MIRIGLDVAGKQAAVAAYCAANDIALVVVLTPDRYRFACPGPTVEVIEYAEIIQYRHFYRLLQEIDGRTLVVVNECLRTQNRHDLTYNCIRHFLLQTPHQAVFQWLPIIDEPGDAMTLIDWDTRSRYRRQALAPAMLADLDLAVVPRAPALRAVPVATDARTQAAYVKAKRDLIATIGLRDPHTIPRTLLLNAGRAKLAHVDPAALYVGRNNRFKLPNLLSYREPAYSWPVRVFEFCHNFLDFGSMLALSPQPEIEALVSDLKVDQWYFDRFNAWTGRINDAYAALQR